MVEPSKLTGFELKRLWQEYWIRRVLKWSSRPWLAYRFETP